MSDRLVPKSVADDDDDVIIALETARVEEERGDKSEAARWLQRAASAARKQGRPERAGEVSRLAARLSGSSIPSGSSTPPPPGSFETVTGSTQLLSDADEDFADQTIVDKLPRPEPPRPEPPRPEPPVVSSAPGKPAAAPTRASGPVQAAVRVAVRKTPGGRLEARQLAADETAVAGEEEALLVPVRAGARLF